MTRSLQHEGQLIPYEIRHKARVTRRIHLRLGPEGNLGVIAPRRMSKRTVHNTLQERSHKVVRFLAGALTRQQELPACEYIQGEKHLYMGDYHPLEIVKIRGRRSSVDLVNGCIRIHTSDSKPQAVRNKIITWYRQQAREHFNTRFRVISKNAPWIEDRLPILRLRNMKRTWGSCSARGVITLNPRLIKTPPGCIDYVIAHELCHLQEMNHSKAFYALLDSLYPRWTEPMVHLRAKSHIYLLE